MRSPQKKETKKIDLNKQKAKEAIIPLQFARYRVRVRERQKERNRRNRIDSWFSSFILGRFHHFSSRAVVKIRFVAALRRGIANLVIITSTTPTRALLQEGGGGGEKRREEYVGARTHPALGRFFRPRAVKQVVPVKRERERRRIKGKKMEGKREERLQRGMNGERRGEEEAQPVNRGFFFFFFFSFYSTSLLGSTYGERIQGV